MHDKFANKLYRSDHYGIATTGIFPDGQPAEKHHPGGGTAQCFPAQYHRCHQEAGNGAGHQAVRSEPEAAFPDTGRQHLPEPHRAGSEKHTGCRTGSQRLQAAAEGHHQDRHPFHDRRLSVPEDILQLPAAVPSPGHLPL